MGVRDYTTEQRVVRCQSYVAGVQLAVVVRKPTCQTVYTAALLFGQEIVAAWMAWDEQPQLTARHQLDALLPTFLDPQRAAHVLATCCELVDGKPGDLERLLQQNEQLLRSCAMAMLEVCDLPVIVRRMDVPAMGRRARAVLAGERVPGEEPDPDPTKAGSWPPGLPRPQQEEEEGGEEESAFEAMVATVAQQYGVRPSVVMGWPYEEVTGLLLRWGRQAEATALEQAGAAGGRGA